MIYRIIYLFLIIFLPTVLISQESFYRPKDQKAHRYEITSVDWSPDGKYIVTCSKDSSVKLWNAEAVREIMTFRGHHHQVMAVCFAPNSKQIASVSRDNNLKLWEPDSGVVKEWMLDFRKPRQLLFNPDGNVLAVATNMGAILIDLTNGNDIQLLESPAGMPNSAYSISFSPDGKLLAVGSIFQAQVWDLSSRRIIQKMGESDFMKHNIHDAVDDVAFLSDGNTLIIGRDKETHFFDIKSGKVNKSIQGLVKDIGLSADGSILAINHYGALDVYDTASGDSLRSLDLLRVYIGGISISPDGSRVAVGLKNGKALIWGAESGRRDWLYPAE
ncbi:hypothetical protein GF337_18295 [candidate division KSB1 bacterium]|nr:hypothetical protein [candidate division KSB1 bacterium]